MRKRSSTMISCYPSVTRGQCPITQTPALQGFVAYSHVIANHISGCVVLNHPTIRHDERTLHAGEYSASMQGQGNPHPGSIVNGTIGDLEVARPTLIRPPLISAKWSAKRLVIHAA